MKSQWHFIFTTKYPVSQTLTTFLHVFQKLGIVGVLEAKSDIFLRLHGAFMIGAWIGAASLGKTFINHTALVLKYGSERKQAHIIHMKPKPWELHFVHSVLLDIFVAIGT